MTLLTIEWSSWPSCLTSSFQSLVYVGSATETCNRKDADRSCWENVSETSSSSQLSSNKASTADAPSCSDSVQSMGNFERSGCVRWPLTDRHMGSPRIHRLLRARPKTAQPLASASRASARRPASALVRCSMCSSVSCVGVWWYNRESVTVVLNSMMAVKAESELQFMAQQLRRSTFHVLSPTLIALLSVIGQG